jgi:hypothetical protein
VWSVADTVFLINVNITRTRIRITAGGLDSVKTKDFGT